MNGESAAAYHTVTWLLWVFTAAMAALLTRNPFYLLLIILAAQVVDLALEFHQRLVAPDEAVSDPRRNGWRFFVRLGITFAVIGAVFNALGAHIGDTVLVRLPAEWPLIGGPLTLEGLVFGALNGFSLVTLLIVAATFSSNSDTYAMLRSTPPFLYQAGVITSIGLAYVPQTLTRAQEIREAQILRGHRFRSARDMLPLAVPLLAGGLERALQLAEAMESRGYSRKQLAPDALVSNKALQRNSQRANVLVRVLLVFGTLALVFGGTYAVFNPSSTAYGWLLMLAGVAALISAFYLLGKRSHRTRYRREVWRRRDSQVTAATALSLAVVLYVWLFNPGLLAYSPYPVLSWPDVQLPLAFALLLLSAPALPLLLRGNV